MSYTYEYPRPAVTVDCVLLRENGEQVEVLLIQRKNEPFKGQWALPGGFIDEKETLEEAVARELKEETGITNIELFQFRAYSEPDRDPRGRTISMVYIGALNDEEETLHAGDDAKNAQWHSLNKLQNLAFDHEKIIFDVLQYIQEHF